MSNETQRELANQFQKMHTEKKILLLPNAWDAGGAVIFEKDGFSAIGTSSAGISYSLGYPDGEYISFDDIVDTTKKIKKRISIPLSVDVERGYGKDITATVQNIRMVIEEGAVGINLEDGLLNSQGLVDMKKQCDLISEISKLKDTLGINFVINARTDAYWLNLSADKNVLFEQTIQRANLYLKAGADCIFVPGILDIEEIKMFVDEINGPLNIIITPNTPSIDFLEKLGVARVSSGSAPARASFALIKNISNELHQQGTYSNIFKTNIAYDKLNCIFKDED